MSLYNYFSKIGTTPYNDSTVNNILTSCLFKANTGKQNVIYYPYTIAEGERPDTIAYNYYGDERYAWLVLITNSIVDPYYEWPLSTKEFSDFITNKYGSIANAQEQVAFYRTNWYSDDSMLSVAAFNALSTALKKYWQPIVGYNGAIGSYERKKEDLVLDTNKTVSLTLNNTTSLTIGQKVIQKTSGTITASGYIRAITSTSVTLNHITGAFAVTTGAVGSLTDTGSTVSKSVSDATVIYNGIPVAEAAYWEQVSMYDYENELNESRKIIKLLDRQYLDIVEDQMIELLT